VVMMMLMMMMMTTVTMFSCDVVVDCSGDVDV